ncbi:hypothetical protein EP47_12345 [Legionella norrlandica]|uniref:Uncharacterized protein n=1 Tax=Legionella norrlandica TaxID=1498499 RepID=A0A0A2SRQ6_9GAMM|nr:hypothetical protein [Legionella norrlandica]KGP63815.1 hypothetical protein EP47_12345 [Legionella norrlandica]
MRKQIFLFLLLFLVTSISFANEVSFSSYSNARYNYQLDYPLFLIPQGESENGDGQKFIGNDAELIVYGSFFPILDSQKNQNQFNLEEEFDYEKKRLKQEGFELDYTYFSLSKNIFVISGTSNTQVVYFKKIFVPSCGVHLYFWLYYPKTEKKQWDSWVTKASKSFKYSTKKCQGDFIQN